MNELLKALYDSFYEPLPPERENAEVQDCHQKLIEVLDKPERKLVLQIIDAKDHIAEDLSIDSFMAGFRLAWQLSSELNNYNELRPLPTTTAGMGAFVMSEASD